MEYEEDDGTVSCICPICGHDNLEGPCKHLVLNFDEDLGSYWDSCGGVLPELETLDPLAEALAALEELLEEDEDLDLDTLASRLAAIEGIPSDFIQAVRDKWISLKYFEQTVVSAIESTKGFAGQVDDQIQTMHSITWESRSWFATNPKSCCKSVKDAVKPLVKSINDVLAQYQ